jgi:hypothetical protein
MTLMALPCLPVFLAHREPSSTSLFCSLGLVGVVCVKFSKSVMGTGAG